MQPATIRRLLVFGVCLAGAGSLYLVPSMAGPGSQGDPAPARHDRASLAPTEPTAATADPVNRSTIALAALPTAPVASPATRTPAGSGADRGTTTAPRVSRPAATAAPPGRDDTPPGAVGLLEVTGSDPERLTVSWPAAADDVEVVSYKVWMNGFLVLATQRTSATLAWFNDSNVHVLQVHALDAAGNEGPSSPTLLVVRPTPSPQPTPPALSDHTDQTPGAQVVPSATDPATQPAGATEDTE